MLLYSCALAAVVATVNGAPITDEDVEAYAANRGADPADPAARAALVEELVKVRLAADDARASGLAQDPVVASSARWAAEMVLAQSAYDAALDRAVGPDRLRAWYDAHPADFAVRQARVRHVLVAERAEADDVLTQLRGGAAFGVVAAARSKDPGSAGQGGDIGWIEADQVVKPFADAAFAAKPGVPVGPVKSDYGWHVILVDAFRDSVPYEDAVATIEETLRGEAVAVYAAALEARGNVTRPQESFDDFVTPLDKSVAVPADAPSFGPTAAPVTLVVYSDLECPFCERMDTALHALAAARSDVRVVFRHYALDPGCNPAVTTVRHPHACEAAKLVVCAGAEAVPLTTDIFANRAGLDSAKLRALAAARGLKGKKFDACVGSDTTLARVKRDGQDGGDLGVEGTPTVYVGVGGRWYHYERGVDELTRMVAAAVAK